jgi:hypothetical protein
VTLHCHAKSQSIIVKTVVVHLTTATSLSVHGGQLQLICEQFFYAVQWHECALQFNCARTEGMLLFCKWDVIKQVHDHY